MPIVFTLTLREITKIYTVYKSPTESGGRWNISCLSNAPERGIKSVTWTQEERTKKRPSSVQKMETRKLPWVGRYKPSADLHRCRQSGRRLARICSLVSQRAVRAKDGSVLQHSEGLPLGEEMAMTSPQPKTPLAQQVRKKYKKLKSNTSSPSPQIQLSMLVSTPLNELHSSFSFRKEKNCLWGHLTGGWW